MSLPRYPENKNSGISWVGEIPVHWGTLRTKTLFELMKRPPRDEDGVVTAFRDGQVTLRSNRRTDGFTNSLQEIGYQGVRRNDLVIHAMDAFAGAIGVSDSEGKSTPVYSVCRPKEGLSNSRYYARLLRHMALSGFIESLAKGIRERSTEFRWAEAGNVYLPVPPIEEQTAIATFLDRETGKIDTLIAEQEKLLALLAEKRQATISHSVTKGLNPDVPMKDSGVEWLGVVPSHWEVVGLTKYLDSVVDYRGRTPTKVDEGVFLVTAKNIRDGEVDYQASQEYIVPSEYEEVMRRGLPKMGDVLFTTEAPLGQVALVDREDIALAQRIIKFRANPERLINSYLKLWIMSCACQFNLEQLATGSTALGIKGSKVGQVRLCLPPLDEQREIVEYVDSEISKLDILKIEATRTIELLKERRSALISAAVTGKIDVRNAIAAEVAA
ncbi:restriction endonuclease subunit S [Aquitalea pelogenes]|uniref:restriction endonuclease subunit S n=1 Tax=Aquitalea pelogenes TaxID=1293573 RepID=UPI0035B0524C